MRGRTSAGATKDSGLLAICIAKINLSLQNIQDRQTGSRPDRLAKCTGLTGANTNDSGLFLLAVTNFHHFPQNSFPFQSRNDGGRFIRD